MHFVLYCFLSKSNNWRWVYSAALVRHSVLVITGKHISLLKSRKGRTPSRKLSKSLCSSVCLSGLPLRCPSFSYPEIHSRHHSLGPTWSPETWLKFPKLELNVQIPIICKLPPSDLPLHGAPWEQGASFCFQSLRIQLHSPQATESLSLSVSPTAPRQCFESLSPCWKIRFRGPASPNLLNPSWSEGKPAALQDTGQLVD